MTELNEKIYSVIAPNQLAVLSTVSEDNKPLGRYMMTTGDENLNLWCVTGLSSRKVKNIRNNPYVHVTVGFKAGEMAPWVHFSGKSEILTDKASREAHWDDMLKQYFKGPDDPEYCILKLVPERIEYWAGWTPEIWEK